MSSELVYVALLFGLFVLPKFLQRFRIPSAVSSLVLGVVLGAGFQVMTGDTTLHVLAVFGISSLFLFAGLEVDADELRAGATVLLQHLALRVVTLGLTAYAVHRVLGFEVRPSVLVALALLTPSTGFILDSINALGLDPKERFWIKSKAISSELLALGTLFVVLQSTTLERLVISGGALVLIALLLPLLFRFFASMIVPFAPRSEFAFLLMMAVVCAYATRRLGVYYLVGAFVVGVAAKRFRERLPALASERMLHAVEVFASVFVPFYFFSAGLDVPREALSWTSLAMGAGFLGLAVPLRLFALSAHRRLVLGETWSDGARIGISLLPTLVFTLVLAQILREDFGAPVEVLGGLIVYTVVTTMIPSLILRLPPPEFDAPRLAGLDGPLPPPTPDPREELRARSSESES